MQKKTLRLDFPNAAGSAAPAQPSAAQHHKPPVAPFDPYFGRPSKRMRDADGKYAPFLIYGKAQADD